MTALSNSQHPQKAASAAPSEAADASSTQAAATTHLDAGAKLQGAVASASYNIVLQTLFRISTFALNAVVLRYAGGDTLGIANVRLLLLYSTSLFLGREALRKACLSAACKTQEDWRRLFNLVWLGVPFGAICVAILCVIWTSLLEQPLDPKYPSTVAVYGLCVVAELAVEPLWVMAQMLLLVRIKVVAEGIALAARSVALVSLLIFTNLGLHAFAVGQACFSVALLTTYAVYFASRARRGLLPISSLTQILPIGLEGRAWFKSYPPQIAQLALTFTQQSLLKQLLTEGERFVMTIANTLTFKEQGVYDVINNLGSLVPRLLFQPIEESFYTFFAGLLDRSGPKQVDADTPQENDVVAARTLRTLLRLVVAVGLVICVFGQAYAYLALDLYGGTLLSAGEGPLLLRSYTAYVVLLAINGVTECFAAASMAAEDVQRHNRWLLVFSVVFVLAAWQFTLALGSVGFIVANSVNMLVRIMRSVFSIGKYFSVRKAVYKQAGNPLSCRLDWRTILVLAASLAITLLSEQAFCVSKPWVWRLLHIAVGGVMLALLLVVGYVYEKEFIQDVKDLVARLKNKKKPE
eukprot:m.133947 g.133947  ORF g.133947 m.133947 type:complete len:579 (+) comp16524_c0_seq1:29-1765(+)